MQLEVGKYYKTRYGEKVGPMHASLAGDIGGFYSNESGLYRAGGVFGYGDVFYHRFDVIEEWSDETAPMTANEHLRKACELFLASGNDKAAFDVLGWIIENE